MTNYSIYIPTTGERETLKEILVLLRSYGTEPNIFLNNAGKKGFWKVWDDMLNMAHDDHSELYIFTADDFTDLDLKRVFEIHEEYKTEPYAYNIINDGRSGQWTGIQERKLDDKTIISGMIDCGFFCNRSALEKIGFYVTNPKKTEGSSGVGQQLSMRFLLKRIVMYKPVRSIAYHGDHESIMHPEERKINPLISI